MRLLACHSLTCASLALAIWHLPLNSGGLRGKDLLVVWVAPHSQPGKPASCRDSLPPKEHYVKDYIKKLIVKT